MRAAVRAFDADPHSLGRHGCDGSRQQHRLFLLHESARIAWLEEAGALPDPSASGEGPAVVNAYCSFLKQLTCPGEIEVSTFVGPPGRSSIEVTHEIRLAGPDGQAGALHAEGGAKMVWIDFKAEKSRPLPERLRALLPAAE